VKPALRGTLVLAATLVAGVALGAAGHRMLGRRSPESMRGGGGGPGSEFRALDLTPEQCAVIDSVMGRARPRMGAVFNDIEVRMRAVNDSIKAEIDAVLTPSQRATMDSLTAHRPGFGMGRGTSVGSRGGSRDSQGFRGGRGRWPSVCSDQRR